MRISKKQTTLAVVVLIAAAAFFLSCAPREERNKNRFFSKEANEMMQTITEKMKNGSLTLKDTLPPDMEKAIAERIKTVKLSDFTPHPSVMIAALMIPIVSVIAFFAFLIVLLKLYHMRVMAMIEKGNYERRPLNIKWELVFLFIGLVLSFVGPGISIYMVSAFGLASRTITAGIVPLFIGIAFLVFYKLYYDIKKK